MLRELKGDKGLIDIVRRNAELPASRLLARMTSVLPVIRLGISEFPQLTQIAASFIREGL